jgi:hypothetical protein
MGGPPPNGSDGSNDRGHGGDPTDFSTRQPLQTMMIIGSRNMGPKSSVPAGERARETGLHFSPPQIGLALVPLAAADVWTVACPILPPPTGKDGGSRCLAVVGPSCPRTLQQPGLIAVEFMFPLPIPPLSLGSCGPSFPCFIFPTTTSCFCFCVSLFFVSRGRK